MQKMLKETVSHCTLNWHDLNVGLVFVILISETKEVNSLESRYSIIQ